MDSRAVREAEKRMERENAVSVMKKIAFGSLILLLIGIAEYAMLFVLMIFV